MIGWEPDYYKSVEELPDSMPEVLKATIKQKTETNANKVPPVRIYC